jgi:hypothetical protein
MFEPPFKQDEQYDLVIDSGYEYGSRACMR